MIMTKANLDAFAKHIRRQKGRSSEKHRQDLARFIVENNSNARFKKDYFLQKCDVVLNSAT
jgi:ferritin